MVPLGVFLVSLCTDGMVPETPLGQKDPCNPTWIKDERAGVHWVMRSALINFVSSLEMSLLWKDIDHQSKRQRTEIEKKKSRKKNSHND